ncbi:hypothetical protein CEE44_04635 [Candidatus Woesearchaeota archaeon B3_Woes]|nr:MAG: hypothetical protein CEE44_04635 [Candidatus Woesearchaeota archaeon B3_Woes]
MGAKKVLSNFNLKKISSSVRSLFNSNKKLKKEIEILKEQVEDHLSSINQNTNEIQSNYEYSLKVDPRINKLSERIDEMSMVIGLNKHKKNPEMPKLTTIEKEIFLALYTQCEEREYTTYKNISTKVRLSETLVMNYLTILIEKGIPIIKSYSDDTTKIKLSSYFKTLQTKKNVLKINADFSKQSALAHFIEG